MLKYLETKLLFLEIWCSFNQSLTVEVFDFCFVFCTDRLLKNTPDDEANIRSNHNEDKDKSDEDEEEDKGEEDENETEEEDENETEEEDENETEEEDDEVNVIVIGCS